MEKIKADNYNIFSYVQIYRKIQDRTVQFSVMYSKSKDVENNSKKKQEVNSFETFIG